MSTFTEKLVLNRWMTRQFGINRIEDACDRMEGILRAGTTTQHDDDVLLTMREIGRTLGSKVSDEQLETYSANVLHHWGNISTRRRTPKGRPRLLPFQYFALMYVELYLDLYFHDPEVLITGLNATIDEVNGHLPSSEHLEPYSLDDLSKLALWVATGGGKTLLMHANILQFLHYSQRARSRMGLNNIILLTTSESLSEQHHEEFRTSHLLSELISTDHTTLWSESAIKIVDIHKLRDEAGERTISVDAFDRSNLVLVDEGHRGSTGMIWREKRKRLCESGFSIEYSATFGQAIRASDGSRSAPTGDTQGSAKHQLTQEYAKCILIDYSYSQFYNAGYGKEHSILNLQQASYAESLSLYLTGCLLVFYQQKHYYHSAATELAAYLLDDPLWTFIGGKVNARNEANPATMSDIEVILRFIVQFLTNADNQPVRHIAQLLSGTDDLRDRHGRSIFAEALDYVRAQRSVRNADALYHDVLETVFRCHANGRLELVQLAGAKGEIGLRAMGYDWFGVINVGEPQKLCNTIEETLGDNVLVTKDEFTGSLFSRINSGSSPINLLIGARKFIEGWSSWRVSTMGLMNVGRREGAEIMQIFGRGVRLRGYEFSLKRSSDVPGVDHPKNIHLLETLQVFGIRSDYMQTFDEYLETDSLSPDDVCVIHLPVIKTLTRDDLKVVRSSEGAVPFESTCLLRLTPENWHAKNPVTVNWYPRIDRWDSSRHPTRTELSLALNRVTLGRTHTAFLDIDEILLELWQFKHEHKLHNLEIHRDDIITLMNSPSWYILYAPNEFLVPRSFDRVREWHNVTVELLKHFALRHVKHHRMIHESHYMEYRDLDPSDANLITEYSASIRDQRSAWIHQLGALRKEIEDQNLVKDFQYQELRAINASKHVYFPLIQLESNRILKVKPVPLNASEMKFVQDLEHYCNTSPDALKGKELYVMRNQSRGRGMGFFEAGNYFPDFVLWATNGEVQNVCFVDPKGLRMVRGFTDPKVQFSHRIKDIEQRLGDPMVTLDSFILSNTPQEDVWWAQSSGNGIQQFLDHHIIFQQQDANEYIGQLLELWLATKA